MTVLVVFCSLYSISTVFQKRRFSSILFLIIKVEFVTVYI